MQTLLPGPGPDDRPVDPRASCPGRAGSSAAADPPSRLDIRLEGLLELGLVLLGEVYFIADAIQAKGDGFGTVRAIQVVADDYLYVSRHARNNADGSSGCQNGTQNPWLAFIVPAEPDATRSFPGVSRAVP